MTDSILDDKRPIKSIENVNAPEFMYFCVGSMGVTKIVAYSENGSMAPIPFYAVYKGDEISHRVPADAFCVAYQVQS